MITAETAYELTMNEGRRKLISDQLLKIEGLIIEAAKEKVTCITYKFHILSEVHHVLLSSGYKLEPLYASVGFNISWSR